jgi:hypothetical protein
MNYHNKKFKVLSNSDNGELPADFVFHYRQAGNIITCEYHGGEIQVGHLTGIVDQDGNIEISYHQINDKGELKTGICSSTPEIMSNGKIRLIEKWQWTSGDQTSGSSILEEC